MPSRISAFLVWALVAASAVAWGLRLLSHAPVAPPQTVSVGDGVMAGGDLSRVLGVAPVAVAQAAPTIDIGSRFRLTGVLAPKPPSKDGVALIAVDGRMPRAYPVGAALDAELVLQSVSLRSASIGSRGSPPAAVLQLPPPAAAATGTMPPFNSGAAGPAFNLPQFPGAVPPPPEAQAQPPNEGQRSFAPLNGLQRNGAPSPAAQ